MAQITGTPEESFRLSFGKRLASALGDVKRLPGRLKGMYSFDRFAYPVVPWYRGFPAISAIGYLIVLLGPKRAGRDCRYDDGGDHDRMGRSAIHNPSIVCMRVGTAREAAVDWVMRHARRQDGFRGAYFSGSTVRLPADAELPPSSDVDVVVVLSQDEVPLKLGKFVYQDTLLEVTYLPWRRIASVTDVLTSHHLAGSFRVDTIIADPTGDLRGLQVQVSRLFADRMWVRCRCENAYRQAEQGLQSIDPLAPWHDQETAWLFSTSVTTLILLVAALRNPTVRLRYLATRDVLTEYDHADLYPDLLRLLGCAELTPQRAEYHLLALAETFDMAAATAGTPFFFSSDITAEARPIAIDGSRDLIRTGNHCEAVFWIVATFARCHKILAVDAPRDTQRALTPAFDDILADLGIASTGDLHRRAKSVIQFLPTVWATAEAILSTNPEIADTVYV